MIGVFDSGFGGLTILNALEARLPERSFVYLGDHANAPYGCRRPEEIVQFTRENISRLFDHGCRLVIIACNTASAVALHQLQRYWLPEAWPGRNVLGIIVPTIEAATQVPWAINYPVYPQMYNNETIAVFGTQRTVESFTYPVEINKRCPSVRVVQQACPELAGAIENGVGETRLRDLVREYVEALLAQPQLEDGPPDAVILGCTHYPLVKRLFHQALPRGIKLLCQPSAVANSLEHYLQRHPEYAANTPGQPRRLFLTTGDPLRVTALSANFLGRTIHFLPAGEARASFAPTRERRAAAFVH